MASLDTEVSQSSEKLAKKMQELNKKLIVDEIFVRNPGSRSNFILGPCFKTTIPPQLSALYPLAEGEKLLLQSVEPDWFKGKTLKSWPNASRTWIDWVDRVEKEKWEVWKSADIYDAIQLSKIDIAKDENLLYAALYYWSISTNSFHFRFGMMGPTVLDIVALTGLRPHGEEVSVILRMAGSSLNFPKYEKVKECLTYCKYLDVPIGAMDVTEEEHISFLVMWLCKYLFCNSSVTMIDQCTKLAFALAAGRKIALAPFLLSNLYHGCNDAIKGKFDHAGGPFWILQLWLQSYFPEHQPLTSDDGNAPTYGYPLAEGVLRCKSFKEYFLFFHECSSRTASQFTPFLSRKFGPEWFKRSLDPYFQKLNRSELKDVWASYLIARALPYSILLDESSTCKSEVEGYSPNQFARQFGLTQAVPLHQPANNLSIKREDFQPADYIEEAESKFFQLKRKFKFIPFDTNPSSTVFFNYWWSTYIKTRDKTASGVLRKISPCVIPLSPSLRQKVASLRSNGIKGYPLSAGNFGRTVKRKYKEISALSQSSVEQEDPRQQRNSHGGAETISTTTRTFCKKPKISMRTIPVPCTSTYPTSCTPADEDLSEADEQVSVDDTSVSTSSSTSVEDGEKCTVSPSVAKTRRKSPDISEQPDCPVKFDNLEDFFARVSGQIKRAQSVGFSTDQCSTSMYGGKIPSKQKSPPSAEMLAIAKDDIERILLMPSQHLLLPENCSALSSSLSIYAASPDLSVERTLALKKLVEDLPYLSSTFHRAKKDQEEYYKTAAKKLLLIDDLTKDHELYNSLKDHDDKLECTISKLKARLKDAKAKRIAIQEQKLSLAKKCFDKSNVLDEMEAESPRLEKMKEFADSDFARVEATLRDFKTKVIE